jgi:hypothetical protein
MAPPTAIPGDLLEVVEYAGTAIRCPACKQWVPRLLLSEMVGHANRALLLCEGCTAKARIR